MSTFRACIAVEPEEAVAKYHKLPGKEANTKHLQGDSFAAQPKGINVTGHNDEKIIEEYCWQWKVMINDAAAGDGGGGHDGADPDGDGQDGDTMFWLLWLLLSLKQTTPIVVVVADVANAGTENKCVQ